MYRVQCNKSSDPWLTHFCLTLLHWIRNFLASWVLCASSSGGSVAQLLLYSSQTGLGQYQCGTNVIFFDKWKSKYICDKRFWMYEYLTIFVIRKRSRITIRINFPHKIDKHFSKLRYFLKYIWNLNIRIYSNIQRSEYDDKIVETMLASTLVSDMKGKMDSNIPLCLKEFPKAKPEGIPAGEGVYLTEYPESSPNTDSISFQQSLE